MKMCVIIVCAYITKDHTIQMKGLSDIPLTSINSPFSYNGQCKSCETSKWLVKAFQAE